MLDRIDLQLFVPRVEKKVLAAERAPPAETSAQVQARVIAAHERQRARQGKPNARLTPKEVDQHCVLEPAARQLLDAALSRLSLSARAYHRLVKVARTAADLAGAEIIGSTHVAEAVQFRELDKVPA